MGFKIKLDGSKSGPGTLVPELPERKSGIDIGEAISRHSQEARIRKFSRVDIDDEDINHERFEVGYGGTIPDRAPQSDLSAFMKTYENHPWVFSCVNAIATACASVKFNVTKEGVEVPDSEDICKLLLKPNPWMTWYDLIESTFVYLELSGNVFWEIVRDKQDNIIAIIPLRPDKMEIRPDAKKKYKAFVYHVRPGKSIVFDVRDIVHIGYFSPINEYWGVAPTSAGKNSLTLDFYSIAYNKNFFKNSAVPEGVLETEHSLSDRAYNRMNMMWTKRHAGVRNAFVPAILEEGLTYKPIGFTNREMQHVQTRKFSREEILAIYKVPPVMVGVLEHANFATSREQKRIFWFDNIIPKLRRLEMLLNTSIMTEGYDFSFSIRSIESIVEDENIKSAIARQNVTGGIMTINEVRERYYGMAPVPWGNTWWAPVGFAPVQSGMHPGTPERAEDADTVSPPEDTDFGPNSPVGKTGSRMVNDKTFFMKELEDINPEPPDPQEHPKDYKRFQKWMMWKDSLTQDERDIRSLMRLYFRQQLKRIREKLERDYPIRKKTDLSDPFYRMGVKKANEDVERYVLDLEEESPEFFRLARPTYLKIMARQGRRLLTQIGSAATFDIDNKRVVDFVERVVAVQGSQINGVSQELVRREVAEAISQGEDIKQVMNRLTQFFEGPAMEFRARRIARTEVVTLANGGKSQAMREAGVKKKEWISELITTTRKSHGRDGVHGVVVKAEERFEVRRRDGGVDLMDGPGDPSGSAENIVHCLCTVEPYIETEEFR